MRILYVDCDSLRPDHLGCYGYRRKTSPNIDRIASDGRRFTNYYASDVPCLPSRTAFFAGQFGIETGVVNHGGTNATPRSRGSTRGFDTARGRYRSFPTVLRQEGHRTAFISVFPQRHGAWYVLDGFTDWVATGMRGRERADVVTPPAREWLETHATEEDWYLHVNYWDPHTHTTPLPPTGRRSTPSPLPPGRTPELSPSSTTATGHTALTNPTPGVVAPTSTGCRGRSTRARRSSAG